MNTAPCGHASVNSVCDDVAVDTVVELLDDVLFCVVAELVLADVAVDTVDELLTDAVVLVL